MGERLIHFFHWEQKVSRYGAGVHPVLDGLSAVSGAPFQALHLYLYTSEE